ncbi:leucine-rich repeat domain-containing protein [Flagellimonas nanhaiensis]|uniref:Leucine-rich repeat domain-containing protein n=1 Tax=Flagellimonas nanhaiensis TaxID=2292706 RepID=A0A371JMV3_9FLAO|nr:leucine-rich repeat domain-containing protein [Allomuricauda nanhaiensis]RDY58471.1 leucine-rich repeat domain-containing protein [Allomuricauda nanhaiensis]
MKKFYYTTVNGESIRIDGLRDYEEKIKIPSEIDGMVVTHIGSGAFRGNQLTSIEIPNSVTHIGSGAFDGNQLTSIEIPNSVTHIGDWAFDGNQLTSIEIPNSVTHIGDWAFDGNQLTSIEIPNSVTHIGDWAFDGNQLTSIEIPNSVTHIGDWAFEGNQLTSIEIPNSVTHIGSGAFDGNQLTSIEIPNSVTHIGSGAFRGNQLTSIEIPNSVTHIGDWAFDGNVRIIQGNKSIRMIDGIATVMRKKRKVSDMTIYEGKFFNRDKKCFVASKGEYWAHGHTIREAIDDVVFKFMQEDSNIEEVVSNIKKSQIMTVNQFRLLTGACRAGCQNFLEQRKMKKTSFPLNEALDILNGQYGWSRIQEFFV